MTPTNCTSRRCVYMTVPCFEATPFGEIPTVYPVKRTRTPTSGISWQKSPCGAAKRMEHTRVRERLSRGIRPFFGWFQKKKNKRRPEKRARIWEGESRMRLACCILQSLGRDSQKNMYPGSVGEKWRPTKPALTASFSMGAGFLIATLCRRRSMLEGVSILVDVRLVFISAASGPARSSTSPRMAVVGRAWAPGGCLQGASPANRVKRTCGSK